MREVVLHIGTHKTGTTSIQAALSGFDDGVTFYSSISVNHSVPFYTIFSRKYKEYHYWRRLRLTEDEIETKRNGYLEKLKSELSRSDRERLVISGEDISALGAADKQKLVAFLKSYDVDVKVICYVRNPKDFSIAVFQELVKQGKTTPRRIVLDYERSLNTFLEIIPRENIVVKEFNRETLFEGDVVADFCREIGVTLDRTEPVRANESLSSCALKLVTRFNSLPVCSEGNAELVTARNEFINLIRVAYADCPKLKSEYLIERLDCPQSELVFLAKNFGITFEIPELVQDLNLTEYLSDLSDLTTEPIDRLLEERHIDPVAHRSIDEKLIALFYGNSRTPRRLLEQTQSELEYYKAEVMSRHSKLAELIDFCDYKSHLMLSNAPFVSEKTREKFRNAAESRKRPELSAFVQADKQSPEKLSD